MNIGNPDELTVLDLAHAVLELTGSSSTIVHEPLPTDDPTRRRPDITVARRELGWEPVVTLEEGLRRTADFFASGDRVGEAGDPGMMRRSGRRSPVRSVTASRSTPTESSRDRDAVRAATGTGGCR